MNPEDSISRETLWRGKSLKEALQDQQARAMTGYKYKELAQLVKAEEDMLSDEDIAEVDASVNILAHMFIYFRSKS